MLDGESTSLSRVRLVEDHGVLERAMVGAKQPLFEVLTQSIMQTLPVPQATLQERVLPIIRDQNQRYRKFQQVHARAAKDGEVIVSITSDGEETTKAAKAGDYVVKNLTEAQEQYVVGGSTFPKRYDYLSDVDADWKLYAPKGEVLAIEISRTLTSQLNVGDEFFITAAWGSDQLAKEGDMLVSTLPELKEVYRIARQEFFETYRLVKPST